MRKKILLLWLGIISFLLTGISSPADVVAYWRFEDGTAGTNVTHNAAAGTWAADIADASGNGNTLSVWTSADWAGHGYRADVPASVIPQTDAANNLSVKNAGGSPGMWTSSTAMQTMTPAAWTIEVSFKVEDGNYRTIIGRDSQGSATTNSALAALYLQAIPDNAIAIKYCDVSGVWHQAVSDTGVFESFDYSSDPDGESVLWCNVAAVSDGTLLSLYLDSGSGYELIAQTDMSGTSDNTALTAGTGDGDDWDAGNWTVARGLYDGGHTDRAYGYVDEIRISDTALDVSEFLFTAKPTAGVVITPSDLAVNEEGQTSGDLYFSLEYEPSANVVLDVAEQDGRGQVTLDRTTLMFTTSNWDVPQAIRVTAVDDADVENKEQEVSFSVTVSSASDESYDGFEVDPAVVTVLDNECGAWGYAVADLNQDCQVNMSDLAVFAAYWMDCSFSDEDGCTNFFDGD